jgi:hypothetical protein
MLLAEVTATTAPQSLAPLALLPATIVFFAAKAVVEMAASGL